MMNNEMTENTDDQIDIIFIESKRGAMDGLSYGIGGTIEKTPFYGYKMAYVTIRTNYGIFNSFKKFKESNTKLLKKLDISNNNLQTLDCEMIEILKSSDNLIELNLSGNYFANINFIKHIKNLKYLVLESLNKKINSNPFVGIDELPCLEYLNMANNKWHSIFKLSLPNLKKLVLPRIGHNNQFINGIPLSNFINLNKLKELIVYDNDICMSSLDKMPDSLEYLEINTYAPLSMMDTIYIPKSLKYINFKDNDVNGSFNVGMVEKFTQCNEFNNGTTIHMNSKDLYKGDDYYVEDDLPQEETYVIEEVNNIII